MKNKVFETVKELLVGKKEEPEAHPYTHPIRDVPVYSTVNGRHYRKVSLPVTPEEVRRYTDAINTDYLD